MVQDPGTINSVTTTGSPLRQSHVVLSLLCQSRVVLFWVWLLRLGLNPSANLPLQPRLLLLQSRGWGWFTINYYRKDLPLFFLWGSPPHTHLLGSPCLLPEERHLSVPETGEKERNYIFKSYTDLE